MSNKKLKLRGGFIDIADIKRVEMALRESENKYRILVENASDIIYRTDALGHINFFNTAAVRLTGYAEASLIGKHFSELIQPDCRAEAERFYGRQFIKNIPNTYYELPILTRDKGVIWLGQNVQLITDDGQVVGFHAIARDITERKQIEEALKYSEARFKSIVATSKEWIWSIDTNGRHTFSNSSVEHILGYRPDEFVGNRMFHILHEEDRPRIMEVLSRSIEQKTGWSNLVLRWRHRDGTYRYLEGNAVPLFDSAGILEGFQGSDRDITDRKYAEKVLQESEYRFRYLFEQMNSAVAVYEAVDDGEDFIFQDFNGAAERIEKVKKEDLLGRRVTEVFPGVQEFGIFTVFQRVWRTGVPEDYDISFYRDNRISGWRENHVYKLPSGEIVAIYNDVTVRKQMEEAMILQRERLDLAQSAGKVGIFDRDMVTGRSTWTPQLEIIYGIEPRGVTHTDNDWITRIHPDDLNEARSTVQRCIREQLKGIESDYRIVRPGGEVRWISNRADIFYDASGKPVRMVGTSVDITERKRAEMLLTESEQKYRLVVENAGEAILIAQDGMIKYVNPITLSILGYSEEKVRSKPFIEFIHPDDREKLLSAHIRRMQGEDPNPVRQFRVLCQDGSVRWADSNAVVILWEGKPATLNFLNDITERKKTEEELDKSIKRLRMALGAAVQAMAVTVETRDPYTAGHQRRVADLARSIAWEIGLTADQIDGIRMAGIIHDLGKISVPAEILSKPTQLTSLEISLIKTHSQSGYDILKDIEFPWPIARIVLEHHEMINGSGYPKGLTGDELLIESKVLSVADVVEAMASHRPYRPGLGIDKALEEIAKNRDILYDPDVVDACLNLFRKKAYKLIN